MLGLLAIAVLYMGIYPKPFTDVMNASVADLLQARGRVQAELSRHENEHMLDKSSLIVVRPEILLLVMACVIALVDLGVKTPPARPDLLADPGHAGRRRAGCTGRLAADGQTALRLRQHGRERPHGQLAQVLRHPRA